MVGNKPGHELLLSRCRTASYATAFLAFSRALAVVGVENFLRSRIDFGPTSTSFVVLVRPAPFRSVILIGGVRPPASSLEVVAECW